MLPRIHYWAWIGVAIVSPLLPLLVLVLYLLTRSDLTALLAGTVFDPGALGTDALLDLGGISDKTGTWPAAGASGIGGAGSVPATGAGNRVGSDPFSRGVEQSVRDKYGDWIGDMLFGEEPSR